MRSIFRALAGASAAFISATAPAVVIPFDIITIDTTEDQVLDVFAIDFDDDGDLDVLSGSGSEDRVVLFENDGSDPPVYTRRNLITTASSLSSFDVADIDADGDYDIIITSETDDAVTWYEQTPGMMPSDPPVFIPHPVASADNPTRVRLIDLDHDGDLDVIYTAPFEIAWAESDGAPTPLFTERPITTTQFLTLDIRAADLNNDGDLDLVAAGKNAGPMGSRLVWFESDGATPPVFTEHLITTTLTGPRSVVVADINRDQITDLVVASETDGRIAWFERDDQSPPNFTEHVVSAAAPAAWTVAVEDLDSDGFPDIAAALSGSGSITWFNSDGASPPVFTPRVVASVPASLPRDVFIADLDGDSDPDLLAARAGDDTVVAFINELAPVRNLTLGTVHQTIADALLAARNDDVISVAAFRFEVEPTIDFQSIGVTLRSSQGITQPDTGDYTLADGATLFAPSPQPATFAGDVTAPFGARTNISAASVSVASTGVLFADPAAQIILDSALTFDSAGVLDILGGSILTSAAFLNTGAIAIVQGVLAADSIDNQGTLAGSGDIFANVTSAGDITLTADTLLAGSLVNDGTVTIQSGVFTILGTLTNNGTIVGDLGARGASPAGIFVNGALTLGSAAALELGPGARAVVAGSVSATTTDASLFNLAEAELRAAGLGAIQRFEAMSTDEGPDIAALTRGEPGRFPIGTLRIGPTSAVVELADDHDNDGLPLPEAVYVRNLVIDPGAELRTAGTRVYYETLTFAGTVDHPANLIPLAAAGCAADISADGTVGSTDLAFLLALWGGPGSADLNADGTINAADLAILLSAWGPCP